MLDKRVFGGGLFDPDPPPPERPTTHLADGPLPAGARVVKLTLFGSFHAKEQGPVRVFTLNAAGVVEVDPPLSPQAVGLYSRVPWFDGPPGPDGLVQWVTFADGYKFMNNAVHYFGRWKNLEAEYLMPNEGGA